MNHGDVYEAEKTEFHNRGRSYIGLLPFYGAVSICGCLFRAEGDFPLGYQRASGAVYRIGKGQLQHQIRSALNSKPAPGPFIEDSRLSPLCKISAHDNDAGLRFRQLFALLKMI